MARNEKGLETRAAEDPRAARGVLAERRACPAADEELNQSLEKAGRVADFLELGELMCRDALERDESCGGHFREEYQTAGRARRCATTRSSATSRPGSTRGDGKTPIRHVEPLAFENVHLPQRSYK